MDRAVSNSPSWVAPQYGVAGLDLVLPSICASLGVPVAGEHLVLPPSARAIVVLADGLGDDLLGARSGHAPLLSRWRRDGYTLSTSFPSTTAAGMGTFGVGAPSGTHGLVGYEVLDPDRDVVFNELSWENGPSPEAWQPAPSWFQRAATDGVAVTRIGPGFFDGSGLTRAVQSGGRFVAASDLASRVDAALTAVRAAPRSLVYLYWGEIDKAGHVHGVTSWQWGAELEAFDAEVARLARSVPPDTAVYVTADHGMVDAPFARRLDVAHEPELARGVRHLAGEARARHLHVVPGALEDVRAAWSAVLGESAWILGRDEAVAAGWFGAVRAGVQERIGDLVVAIHDDRAVVDSRRDRADLLALLGHHGSLTAAEMHVPFLGVPARVEGGALRG